MFQFVSHDMSSTAAMLFRRIFPAIMAGLLCGAGLVLALWSSGGARWPWEWDAHRDAAIAQCILDGRYPEDPILTDETSWFNPMTGALTALAAYVTGLTPPEAIVRIGPFVNLLAPLGFYLLLSALFDGRVALAGLTLFFFGKDPAMLSSVRATYTPWLMAPWYAPGLFCLTLLAFYKAITCRCVKYHVLAGVLLGLTFTCHTAPAIVAGATMSLVVLVEGRREWQRPKKNHVMKKLLGLYGLLLLVAFVVSLPYSAPILWQYQFRVVNVWPTLFATQYVELQALGERLWEGVHWRNVLVLLGVISLIRRRQQMAATLVLCFSVVSVLFVLQHYLWQLMLQRGLSLSGVVPGYHAYIYLTLAQAALFGIGAVAVATALSRAFVGCMSKGSATAAAKISSRAREASVLVLIIFLGLMIYRGGGWHVRQDFIPPSWPHYAALHERQIPIYDWIMNNTEPDATFLCPEESVGITVVMPTGRKLVSTMIFYHSPYVSMGPALEAQEVLLAAISAGDEKLLYRYADAYSELYVLIRDAQDAALREQLNVLLEPVYRAGGFSLYHVTDTEC